MEVPRSGSSPTRRWVSAWLGGAVLGIVNGSLRGLTYEKRLSDRNAHQLSTATLITLLALYMRVLQRRWPIRSRRTALGIGGTWVALTVLFEFGFGHYLAGKPWRTLLEDYDLTEGHLWSLVLIWLAIGPAVVTQVDECGQTGGPPRLLNHASSWAEGHDHWGPLGRVPTPLRLTSSSQE